MFNHGVAEAMKCLGFIVETPDDLLTWAQASEPYVILLTLFRPADWTLLARLHDSRPDSAVIAVIEDGDLTGSLRALTSGAAGVIAREADFETVRVVLTAAASGRSVLPVEVVRALTSLHHRSAAAVKPPSETEISWIRLLARGMTVARLARHAGYSERMMFRLLRDLYRKWGVANRTEAIVHARGQDWL
ncbi:MAG: DNA-binding response regulator [Pseudonocardiaceae bacterium]